MSKLISQIKKCRNSGVPLIAVETADPAEVAALVKDLVKEDPVLIWDCVRGIRAMNPQAESIEDALNNPPDPDGNPMPKRDPALATANPMEALRALINLTEKATCVMQGAPIFLTDAACRQAVWNLRDTLKVLGACIVMAVPLGYKLTNDIAGDVMLLTQELPTREELQAMISQIMTGAGLPAATGTVMERATDSLSGLAMFPAESAISISLSKSGIDMDGLWERKRRAIEATKGMSVSRSGESFDDIMGYTNVKDFMKKAYRKARAIIFIDEIEKSIDSGQGDLTGINRDFLSVLLREMEDNKYPGSSFVGPPGSGKTVCARAVGNHFGIPTMAFDFGAMKGGIVGDSETNVRSVFQTAKAVSQGQAYVIATCNGMATLPPELKRRFKLGTFFFDLPNDDELEMIGNLWIKKYDLNPKQKRPSFSGWTGAEVRNCCEIAQLMEVPLIEAATFVVPVSQSSPEQIEKLRRESSGKYISASYPGAYQYKVNAPTVRKVSVN